MIVPIGVVGMVVSMALIARKPEEAISFFEYLTARAKAAKEGKQPDNDLLGGGALLVLQGKECQCGHAKNNEAKPYGIEHGAACSASFNQLSIFRFNRAISRDKWDKVLNDWRQCGDDFLVIGVDGFSFMVRNSRIGRITGLIRLCVWHGKPSIVEKWGSIGGIA